MIEQGASVIDVGGESTRPGYKMISPEEETDRVAPVIEALKREFDIPVSVDTYKSSVAEAALKAGADMVNDIHGLLYDEKMARICKKYDCSVSLMHNRDKVCYTDLKSEILEDLQRCISKAKDAGISDDRIILDPGIGFGKTYEMNLRILNDLSSFHALGYPLLLGASRKSVIGLALGLPVDQREEGTLVTTVLAVQNHYGFVRVHDVEKNMRAIRMMKAVQRGCLL